MRASLTVVLIAALVIGACSAGCVPLGRRTVIEGSGVAGTETRTLEAFTAVAVEGQGEAVVALGGSPSIMIEADENLLEYIETRVKDGVLELRLKHPERCASFRTRRPVRYTITTETLDAVSIAGSGTLRSNGASVDEFDIDIAGSGTVLLDDLTCETVRVDIAGSGDVRMTGTATRQDVSIAGSGNVSAGGLMTERTRIDIAGSGDATLWATEKLRVSVAGSGDVRYYGSPSLSKSIEGVGDIHHLGDKGSGHGEL